MNCMKCGREIEEDQVFCPSCLTDMAQHPVNPATVVLLPNQGKKPVKKAVSRKKPQLSPEELVPLMKKRIWALRILVFILSLIIGCLTFVASRAISELDIQRLLGQNYSTIETVDETTVPGETTESPAA